MHSRTYCPAQFVRLQAFLLLARINIYLDDAHSHWWTILDDFATRRVRHGVALHLFARFCELSSCWYAFPRQLFINIVIAFDYFGSITK
jgi:hypothetical protein